MFSKGTPCKIYGHIWCFGEISLNFIKLQEFLVVVIKRSGVTRVRGTSPGVTLEGWYPSQLQEKILRRGCHPTNNSSNNVTWIFYLFVNDKKLFFFVSAFFDAFFLHVICIRDGMSNCVSGMSVYSNYGRFSSLKNVAGIYGNISCRISYWISLYYSCK